MAVRSVVRPHLSSGKGFGKSSKAPAKPVSQSPESKAQERATVPTVSPTVVGQEEEGDVEEEEGQESLPQEVADRMLSTVTVGGAQGGMEGWVRECLFIGGRREDGGVCWGAGSDGTGGGAVAEAGEGGGRDGREAVAGAHRVGPPVRDGSRRGDLR